MVYKISLSDMTDKQFRQDLRANPKGVLKEMGIEYADDIELVIKNNTKEISYVVLFDPSEMGMSTTEMNNINAAGGSQTVGTGGTAGSAMCLSSVGCSTECFSTFSSASSAGSVGTAGTLKT